MLPSGLQEDSWAKIGSVRFRDRGAKSIEAFTDSSAAKAIVARQGVSLKTKHLAVRALFAQEF